MPFDSLHIGHDGIAHSIRELLESSLPRVRRVASVNLLWSHYAWSRRWGDDLPAPARLVAHPELRCALALNQEAAVYHIDTVDDHVARIVSFIHTFRSGKIVEPLVLGPDGDLWDGLHRLAAMHILRIPYADVLDFGTVRIATPLDLNHVFHEQLLNPTHRYEIAHRFTAATPFRHVYLPAVLREDIAGMVLNELKNLSWQLVETHFYEQYEVSLLDCDNIDVGPALAALREVALSADFASLLTELTGLPSLYTVDIACHKSLTSQQIGIHTDFSEEHEACRLTLHLNPDWQPSEGGLFVTFASHLPASATAAYPPNMNTAILFEISEKSFHAVTPVDSSRPRFSIVIATTRL